jgi:uncharacterized protein YbjT (DUF2867 family)
VAAPDPDGAADGGRIAVLGATGFVGRRLVRQLDAAGHDVVALTRRPDQYVGHGRGRYADLDDPASVATALRDVRAAYHLVHSLGTDGFDRREAAHAAALRDAADDAGLEQLIFLGGLGREDARLSPHLRSRRDVERVLREGSTPVTVLRAGILIGAGSAGWELLRQTVELLPVVVSDPRSRTKHQPIAADDAVGYLVDVLGQTGCYDRTFDIGGPDVLRYRDMIARLAKLTNRWRPHIEVLWMPSLVTGLGAGLLTDVDPGVARDLLGSMPHETVVTERAITKLFPRELLDFEDAARRALDETDGSNTPGAWLQSGVARVLGPLLDPWS